MWQTRCCRGCRNAPLHLPATSVIADRPSVCPSVELRFRARFILFHYCFIDRRVCRRLSTLRRTSDRFCKSKLHFFRSAPHHYSTAARRLPQPSPPLERSCMAPLGGPTPTEADDQMVDDERRAPSAIRLLYISVGEYRVSRNNQRERERERERAMWWAAATQVRRCAAIVSLRKSS